MNRSTKKLSSGYFEGDPCETMKRSAKNTNGESSSTDNWQHTNGSYDRLDAADESEIVTIEDDSDDDNNNEHSSPDRYRAAQNDQDSDATDHRSASSDVIVIEENPPLLEIEELSRIISNVKLDPADKVKADDFERLKLLGTGAYGRVYLVRKHNGKDKGHLYAMKVLEKSKVTQKKKTTEHTRTEREVLEKVIDCPFLATMQYAFQTPDKLYLVLEFYQGGELFTHLYKSEHFTEAQVRFYIAEIIVALEQLHELNVIYRDIKLENILLDENGHIIITDFGLSKELCNGARAHSFCGTIEYMAPEIVSQRKEGHDLNVDWWSVGVLTIELLSGQSPFSREGEESNQSLISERIQNQPPNIPGTIGKDAKDFILKLLEKSPNRRLGYRTDAEELKRHKFFKNIDWAKLKKKLYKAPIIPELRDGEDVSQFAEDFTKQDPVEKPAEPLTAPNAANFFKGYSFVAPHLRRNYVEEVPERAEPSTRPVLKTVLRTQRLGRSKFFKKYEIDTQDVPIGDGTYAICMLCTSVDTKKRYAVKIVSLLHDASQEIEALEACQGHENIVKLVEHMEDSVYRYIVFELLMGGELFSRIRDCSYFSESQARDYFLQLVKAVHFMHQRKIVHRDLKPENILFVNKNDDSQLKIVDFGFARRRTSEETPPCFTMDYAAPESLTKGPTKETRDMWSLGVILYTMMCGNTPFMPQNISKQRDEKAYRLQLTENIKKGAFNISCDPWHSLTSAAQDLIKNLLKVDESERLTLQEVMQHEWLTGIEPMDDEFDDVSANESKSIDEETENGPKVYLNSEPITVDDDSMELPPTKENEAREEIYSNDSSGIVLSDRNEGSSLSSHNDEAEEPVVVQETIEDVEIEQEPEPQPATETEAEPLREPSLEKEKLVESVIVPEVVPQVVPEVVLEVVPQVVPEVIPESPKKRGRKKKVKPEIVQTPTVCKAEPLEINKPAPKKRGRPRLSQMKNREPKPEKVSQQQIEDVVIEKVVKVERRGRKKKVLPQITADLKPEPVIESKSYEEDIVGKKEVSCCNQTTDISLNIAEQTEEFVTPVDTTCDDTQPQDDLSFGSKLYGFEAGIEADSIGLWKVILSTRIELEDETVEQPETLTPQDPDINYNIPTVSIFKPKIERAQSYSVIQYLEPEITQKRGRGRPRKFPKPEPNEQQAVHVVHLLDIPSVENVQKSRRGRKRKAEITEPRKETVYDDAQSQHETVCDDAQLQHETVPADQAADESVVQEPPAKKKRGRKKKVPDLIPMTTEFERTASDMASEISVKRYPKRTEKPIIQNIFKQEPEQRVSIIMVPLSPQHLEVPDEKSALDTTEVVVKKRGRPKGAKNKFPSKKRLALLAREDASSVIDFPIRLPIYRPQERPLTPMPPTKCHNLDRPSLIQQRIVYAKNHLHSTIKGEISGGATQHQRIM